MKVKEKERKEESKKEKEREYVCEGKERQKDIIYSSIVGGMYRIQVREKGRKSSSK